MEIKASEEGMTLRQPQLTHRAIELLHLADANPKRVPVVKPLLSKNVDGKERENDFHCRSVVGSSLCLSGCTRPDMSMAVHQDVKISSDPKRSHGNVVDRIGKCAGSYDRANTEDPALVNSRTVFIVKHANCPITCESKI